VILLRYVIIFTHPLPYVLFYAENIMGFIIRLHSILGEMVLPLVIVAVAIWLTVSWKPNVAGHPVATRLFPVLVDIQVTLGIIIYIYRIVQGLPGMLSFPFILHPILGILAAGVAHMAVKPNGPARSLGRWAPLAVLGILLVIVLTNVFIAMSR
jgi:hypothetical protein